MNIYNNIINNIEKLQEFIKEKGRLRSLQIKTSDPKKLKESILRKLKFHKELEIKKIHKPLRYTKEEYIFMKKYKEFKSIIYKKLRKISATLMNYDNNILTSIGNLKDTNITILWWDKVGNSIHYLIKLLLKIGNNIITFDTTIIFIDFNKFLYELKNNEKIWEYIKDINIGLSKMIFFFKERKENINNENSKGNQEFLFDLN